MDTHSLWVCQCLNRNDEHDFYYLKLFLSTSDETDFIFILTTRNTCQNTINFCHTNFNGIYLSHKVYLSTAQVESEVYQWFSSENQINFETFTEAKRLSVTMTRRIQDQFGKGLNDNSCWCMHLWGHVKRISSKAAVVLPTSKIILCTSRGKLPTQLSVLEEDKEE